MQFGFWIGSIWFGLVWLGSVWFISFVHFEIFLINHTWSERMEYVLVCARVGRPDRCCMQFFGLVSLLTSKRSNECWGGKLLKFKSNELAACML